MSTPPEEHALVERLRAGDGAAFETLVRTYMPVLLRVARRMMRTEEDARDAVQDAFVSAFRSIARFSADARLGTWLHRIVVNACLMRLRTQRRHPEEAIEEYLPRFATDGHQVPAHRGSASESAEALLERAEVRDAVRDAIDRLPDTYREVLVLRDLEELSTEEAAVALGVTPNAVKIRLHRARQALRTMLQPYMTPVTT
jgi:RNA polymerase sigma-70 factor, ECF subfamily